MLSSLRNCLYEVEAEARHQGRLVTLVFDGVNCLPEQQAVMLQAFGKAMADDRVLKTVFGLTEGHNLSGMKGWSQ